MKPTTRARLVAIPFYLLLAVAVVWFNVVVWGRVFWPEPAAPTVPAPTPPVSAPLLAYSFPVPCEQAHNMVRLLEQQGWTIESASEGVHMALGADVISDSCFLGAWPPMGGQ